MKDISVIPKGVYCDGCLYWRIIEDRPNQYNGWCDYLDKGDIELEHECTVSYSKLPEFPVGTKIIQYGLLWDGCKECGINREID